MHDDDDPQAILEWNSQCRRELDAYLDGEGLSHGPIAQQPAWSVPPYVSLWPIESREAPGTIGWWAITGDLPNDYVSATKAANAREAVQAIALLWQEAAQFMARGERHPTFRIGSGERDEELAPMLSSRAELLLEWVGDPDLWEDDEA